MFEQPLNSNTYLLYATKHYNNSCGLGIEEFNADIKLLTYIKRLLRKYHNKNETNVQLLLNQIITMRNIFATIPTVRLLFYYCDSYTYPTLKTILIYLEMLPSDPDIIPEVNMDMIKLDEEFINILRNL